MNPLLLKLIIAIAPSVEQLIVDLINHWADKHADENPSEDLLKLLTAKDVLKNIVEKKPLG